MRDNISDVKGWMFKKCPDDGSLELKHYSVDFASQ